ncbi:hypothetical protein [Gordoniibacillus kamchatkensis]|uniref:hypothetical protein n=1 Tax=Gordoniibacillus kamchatkensis TaxID=1590651 RepID=UPI0018CD4F86|nr:hypothetical protein [Paenibacillus sp. VKM B-2647]
MSLRVFRKNLGSVLESACSASYFSKSVNSPQRAEDFNLSARMTSSFKYGVTVIRSKSSKYVSIPNVSAVNVSSICEDSWLTIVFW